MCFFASGFFYHYTLCFNIICWLDDFILTWLCESAFAVVVLHTPALSAPYRECFVVVVGSPVPLCNSQLFVSLRVFFRPISFAINTLLIIIRALRCGCVLGVLGAAAFYVTHLSPIHIKSVQGMWLVDKVCARGFSPISPNTPHGCTMMGVYVCVCPSTWCKDAAP